MPENYVVVFINVQVLWDISIKRCIAAIRAILRCPLGSLELLCSINSLKSLLIFKNCVDYWGCEASVNMKYLASDAFDNTIKQHCQQQMIIFYNTSRFTHYWSFGIMLYFSHRLFSYWILFWYLGMTLYWCMNDILT